VANNSAEDYDRVNCTEIYNAIEQTSMSKENEAKV